MAEVTHTGPIDFDKMVFQERNKTYGAYVLRERYTKVVVICLLIGIFIIGLIVAIPYISILINSFKPKKEEVVLKSTEVTLTNPPPIDETEPPPPPPASTAPPPQQESVKFTVPVVTEEQVTEDVAVTEELEVSNPGTVTQEGEEGFTTLPGTDDGGGEVIGETKEQIFTIVEKMPEFPGGEDAMNSFLANNIRYPQTAKELGIQGTVYVQFIVDTYGNISNVELLRGIGGGCDDEAIRVVKKMPRWNPGKQGGRPVKVQFRLPIRFKLS